MEKFLETSLPGWKLGLKTTTRAEPQAEWDGMDNLQCHDTWGLNDDWRTLERLGSGCTLGNVFQQGCDNRKARRKLRAVKRFNKAHTEHFPESSYGELKALATFSVQKIPRQNRSKVSSRLLFLPRLTAINFTSLEKRT